MVLVIRHNTLNNVMTPVVLLPKDEATELIQRKNKEISSMVYGIIDVEEIKACLEGKI